MRGRGWEEGCIYVVRFVDVSVVRFGWVLGFIGRMSNLNWGFWGLLPVERLGQQCSLIKAYYSRSRTLTRKRLLTEH